MIAEWPGGMAPCRFIAPKEMSFHPFSFPFSDPARIRQALSLQLASLMGEGGKPFHLCPVVFRQEKDRTRGVALVFPQDLKEGIETAGKARLFPAPLAFGAALQGSGLGVWADEEHVAAVLWREKVPVLYRCVSRAEAEPEELIEWLRSSSGGSDFPVFLLDSRTLPDAAERLEAEARRTWEAFPSLASLDLSPRRMESALRVEHLSASLKPALFAGLVLGILFLAASALSALSAQNRLEAYETASIRLYREVFDPTGPVRDPLSQAKARLAAVSGTDEADALARAFAMLGRASRKSGEGIVLDTLRTSERQTEMIGKGSSVAAVRAFQQALEAKETSLEDLQQLPGGQFRFKITVRGESR
jgi:hypothetical protein